MTFMCRSCMIILSSTVPSIQGTTNADSLHTILEMSFQKHFEMSCSSVTAAFQSETRPNSNNLSREEPSKSEHYQGSKWVKKLLQTLLLVLRSNSQYEINQDTTGMHWLVLCTLKRRRISGCIGSWHWRFFPIFLRAEGYFKWIMMIAIYDSIDSISADLDSE